MGGGGERFVSFTTSKFSRVQSESSSQSFQGSRLPLKSKRPFGKSFLNKEESLPQHNLTSTKNTFSEDCTYASVKTCASFGAKPIFGTLPFAGRMQYFLENSDKQPKNIRMGIWV